jgi:hypothetical protein
MEDMKYITELRNRRIKDLQRELNDLKQAILVDRARLQEQFRVATKAERDELTWQLPELPYYQYDLLQEAGFMTGSKVYSSAVPQDEDWVVNAPPLAFEPNYLSSGNGDPWAYDEMAVLSAHYDGNLINIICAQADTYDLWKKTTLVMKDAFHMLPLLQDPMNIKWARVRLFRAIKDILERPVPGKKMQKDDAIQFNVCAWCHREARNFISKEYENQYNVDGICDRCRTELKVGHQLN